MIDPLDALAFSIHSSPGVYALLLGSGVSRSANIPTGWEVTLDLIRKLAAANDESTGTDPEKWYRDRFDRAAQYSDLVDALGKTPTERQQLLRGYFEPANPSDPDNDKQPTIAHRSIATLVAKGFVRVIVTTNFDRLLEKALAEINIAPVVLSSSDHIQGALPLIHTQCCVVKLHGDYLDSRILNTEEELATYSREYDELLDQILDEFGLVVCGWSGDWDHALRSAIYRASSRRFTTYWATIDEPTAAAQALIEHRGAEVLRIQNADSFFTSIQDRVHAIGRFSRPHPHSVQVAVSRLKHYLSDSKHRIRLVDLVDETVEHLAEQLSGDSFDVTDRDTSADAINTRIRLYDGNCAMLLTMACVAGRWADVEHFTMWRHALQRLDSLRSRTGVVFWLEMQRYPETLLVYALGLGALAGDRMELLTHILSTPVRDAHNNDVPAVQCLPPYVCSNMAPANCSALTEWRGGVSRLTTGYTTHFDPLLGAYCRILSDTRPSSTSLRY